MCENPQFSGDLVPFTKEIPNKKVSPKFLTAVDSLSTFQATAVIPTQPQKAGVTHILKSLPACHKSCLFIHISNLHAMQVAAKYNKE